jgi:hypothetical protein
LATEVHFDLAAAREFMAPCAPLGSAALRPSRRPTGPSRDPCRSQRLSQPRRRPRVEPRAPPPLTREPARSGASRVRGLRRHRARNRGGGRRPLRLAGHGQAAGRRLAVRGRLGGRLFKISPAGALERRGYAGHRRGGSHRRGRPEPGRCACRRPTPRRCRPGRCLPPPPSETSLPPAASRACSRPTRRSRSGRSA